MAADPPTDDALLVIDDCDLVVDGVRAELAQADRPWTVHAATELDAAKAAPARLALWDPGLEPDRVGRIDEVISKIAPTPLVAFSWSYELPLVMESLRQGCAGYLVKSLSRQALATHLDRALADPPVVDQRISGTLLSATARLREGPWWSGEHLGLSKRESEILGLLTDGLDTAQISTQLFLGRETVRTHLRTLYGKLGVRTRTQAIARAYEEGLVLTQRRHRTRLR